MLNATEQIYDKKAPAPSRNQYGEFLFPDYPDFRPNLSPKEVLQMGSFGGTYFRPIKSGCTGKTYGEEVYVLTYLRACVNGA
jgi:hypothetical protein